MSWIAPLARFDCWFVSFPFRCWILYKYEALARARWCWFHDERNGVMRKVARHYLRRKMCHQSHHPHACSRCLSFNQRRRGSPSRIRAASHQESPRVSCRNNLLCSVMDSQGRRCPSPETERLETQMMRAGCPYLLNRTDGFPRETPQSFSLFQTSDNLYSITNNGKKSHTLHDSLRVVWPTNGSNIDGMTHKMIFAHSNDNSKIIHWHLKVL